MLHILDARIKYGSIFIFNIADGVIVHFTPMKFNEFIATREIARAYPSIENFANLKDLKDRVFEEHVIQYIDRDAGIFYIKEKIDDTTFSLEELVEIIPAGVVDSVYSAILEVSGPHNAEELETELNISRNIYYSDIISTMLAIISSTYKIDIDKIKEKDWPTILNMYASSEAISSGNIPKLPLELDKENDK